MNPHPRLPLSRVTDYGLRSPRQEPPRRPTHRSGFAVIVIMVIIAILMIYIAGNIRTLSNVGKELKLIDKRQVHRLETRPRPAPPNTP